MKQFLIIIFVIVLFLIAKIFGTEKPEWSTKKESHNAKITVNEELNTKQ